MYIYLKIYNLIPHGVVPDAVQFTLNFGDEFISVVGGGEGLYGNGKTTFEVLTSQADDVEGHIGKDRVTEILLELQENDIIKEFILFIILIFISQLVIWFQLLMVNLFGLLLLKMNLYFH